MSSASRARAWQLEGSGPGVAFCSWRLGKGKSGGWLTWEASFDGETALPRPKGQACCTFSQQHCTWTASSFVGERLSAPASQAVTRLDAILFACPPPKDYCSLFTTPSWVLRNASLVLCCYIQFDFITGYTGSALRSDLCASSSSRISQSLLSVAQANALHELAQEYKALLFLLHVLAAVPVAGSSAAPREGLSRAWSAREAVLLLRSLRHTVQLT